LKFPLLSQLWSSVLGIHTQLWHTYIGGNRTLASQHMRPREWQSYISFQGKQAWASTLESGACMLFLLGRVATGTCHGVWAISSAAMNNQLCLPVRREHTTRQNSISCFT
jgi:hypothetical protein